MRNTAHIRPRTYVALRPLRRRGGQPGNQNALKHGRRTKEARARRREIHLLLAEIYWALEVVRPFLKRRRRRKSRARDLTSSRTPPLAAIARKAHGVAVGAVSPPGGHKRIGVKTALRLAPITGKSAPGGALGRASLSAALGPQPRAPPTVRAGSRRRALLYLSSLPRRNMVPRSRAQLRMASPRCLTPSGSASIGRTESTMALKLRSRPSFISGYGMM